VRIHFLTAENSLAFEAHRDGGSPPLGMLIYTVCVCVLPEGRPRIVTRVDWADGEPRVISAASLLTPYSTEEREN
jgi:hypothetical protein